MPPKQGRRGFRQREVRLSLVACFLPWHAHANYGSQVMVNAKKAGAVKKQVAKNMP